MSNCRIYSKLNIEEVRKIAITVADSLEESDVIALYGDIGAGKTTFTRFICERLQVEDDVTSPTFSLLNIYDCSDNKKIYHYDMYRITSFEDLEAIGFFDSIDAGGIVIVEWSENIREYIPKNNIAITINRTDDENLRDIVIERE